MKIILCLLLLTATTTLQSSYPRNPHVEDEVWAKVEPYFLSYNCDLRKKLDKIFTGKRVIDTAETLKQAGFTFTETQGTRVFAMKHPKLKGYLVKIYPDNRDTRVDWVSWTNRIIGSRLLKKSIQKHGYSKIFRVPKKWIYPLPAEPGPVEIRGGGRKNFILIAEDVNPYPRKENWARWRNLTKKKTLDALVNVVQEVGAGDCVRANNLPWCSDGRIAMVDTEIYYRWPIRYHPLIEVLKTKMRKYWNEITKGRTEKPEKKSF